jgi:hypothetical protein
MIAINPYGIRARGLFDRIIRRDIFHNPAVALIFRPNEIGDYATVAKHGSDNVAVIPNAPNNFKHIDPPNWHNCHNALARRALG